MSLCFCSEHFLCQNRVSSVTGGRMVASATTVLVVKRDSVMATVMTKH